MCNTHTKTQYDHFTNLLTTLRTLWNIDETSLHFKSEYLRKFGPNSLPVSPTNMKWTSLNLSEQDIKAVATILATQPMTCYPSPTEIITLVKGNPDDLANKAWIRLRSLLTDHTRTLSSIDCAKSETNPCYQALKAIGFLDYLRTLSIRDLHFAEQDFKRMFVYHWLRIMGVES